MFVLLLIITNPFKTVLRFAINPASNRFKNLVPYIAEGKSFFLTFDYSFSREGEDLGKFLSSYPLSLSLTYYSIWRCPEVELQFSSKDYYPEFCLYVS
jgi:hypothetical protein